MEVEVAMQRKTIIPHSFVDHPAGLVSSQRQERQVEEPSPPDETREWSCRITLTEDDPRCRRRYWGFWDLGGLYGWEVY